LGAKGVALLKELLPKASVIAHLVNPSNPSGGLESKETRAAADALGFSWGHRQYGGRNRCGLRRASQTAAPGCADRLRRAILRQPT
jgi:hypothetical protein